MQPFKLDKLFKTLIVICFALICLFILKVIFVYIYPFIIAIVFAFLLHPIVSGTENYMKVSRSIATFIVMGAMCSMFISIFFIFTERLVTGFLALANNLPEKVSYMKKIVLETGQAIYEWLLSFFPILKEWHLTEELDLLLEKISAITIDLTTNTLITASEALSSVSNMFIVVTFIFIAIYMLTKDYHLLEKTIVDFIPGKMIIHFRPVVKYSKRSFLGLLRAQLLITTISTLIILISFYFFKIDHFFTVSLIIFFVDFIPYLGIGIVFVPWILFLFATGQYVLTIKLAALYIFILILRQLIEPKIIAKEIGIHPFIALSILFIGYQAIGILGILLTPFILILVSALHKARMFSALYDYIYKK